MINRRASCAECKKAMVRLYGTDPKSRPDDSPLISPKVRTFGGLIDQKKVVIGGPDQRQRYSIPRLSIQ